MTKGVINAEIRQNDWNIDRSFIFIIPLILVAVLVWMPEEWLLESSLLCIAVFVYILLTYNHRLVYGFSGIRIASIPSTIVAVHTVFIAIPSIYVLMIRDHPNEVPYFYSILLFYILFPIGLFIGQFYRRIDLNRSEEHTSELQSRRNLVCRLLLEKKKYSHAVANLHYN